MKINKRMVCWFDLFVSLIVSFFPFVYLTFCEKPICVFQPTLRCCTLQTLVEICIFNVFCGKKMKTPKKSLHLNWSKFFSGNKTYGQRFGANFKKTVSSLILQHIFSFFSFLSLKTLIMEIPTSIWSVQHSNTCWNIQHKPVIKYWSNNILK